MVETQHFRTIYQVNILNQLIIYLVYNHALSTNNELNVSWKMSFYATAYFVESNDYKRNF